MYHCGMIPITTNSILCHRIISFMPAADFSIGTFRIHHLSGKEQHTVNLVQNKAVNTILSNENGCCIELLHNACDPSLWTIRRSRKILWFRWNSSSYWFYDKRNALVFARKQADDHRAKQA
jgi:hypothetical protein